MLFLVFHLGEDRYALETGRLLEVLPLVGFKQLPRSAGGVVGLCDHRGEAIPVVDLTLLALGRRSVHRLSSRLVIAECPDYRGKPLRLGVVIEKATQLLQREPSDFVPSGVDNSQARYLGPITRDERGMIQWVDVDALLPAETRAALLAPAKP